MPKDNKTKPTGISVASYLAGIEDETRRKDCRALAKLMETATGEKPKMWGTSIVGFGSYHYKYDSGHEGDSCLTGFASRKSEIAIYLMAEFPKRDQLLAKLGKHKMGKGCLYIKKMEDVDPAILGQLVSGTLTTRAKKYA